MKTPLELLRTTFARLCRACPKSFELGGLALAALLAALLAVGVTPARAAVSTNSDFELDGDAVNSGAVGDDWSNVLGFPPPPSGSDSIHVGPITEPHLRFTQGTKRSEEHTSELQSPCNLVCRLLLEKKKNNKNK